MVLSVFSGDDTGLLKQVALGPSSTVVRRWGTQGCGRGIARACWGPDGDETHIGLGLDDGAVRFYRRPEAAGAASEGVDDPSESAVLEFAAAEGGIGAPYGGGGQGIAGLHASGGAAPRVVAATRQGRVRVWSWPTGESSASSLPEPLLEFETSKAAAVARIACGGSAVALGGKAADASVWSLESGTAVWRARNLANDELDLEVPIWLTDLRVVEETPNVLVTGHGFVQQRLRGEVRLYDISAQRKPVARAVAPLGEEAVSAVAVSADGRHVFAGSVCGSLARLDVRMNLKPVERYRNIAGSIREIELHPSLPLLACACLDRKMRIYNWGYGGGRWSTERTTEPIATVYLKQRLSAVLFSADAGSAAERRVLGVKGKKGEDEEEEGEVGEMLADLPEAGPSRAVEEEGEEAGGEAAGEEDADMFEDSELDESDDSDDEDEDGEEAEADFFSGQLKASDDEAESESEEEAPPPRKKSKAAAPPGKSPGKSPGKAAVKVKTTPVKSPAVKKGCKKVGGAAQASGATSGGSASNQRAGKKAGR